MNIPNIVKDIRTLADSIHRRWARGGDGGGVTWGVKSDAECISREADMAALQRCIDWQLDQAPAGAVRAYAAAERLNGVLDELSKRHLIQVQQRLNGRIGGTNEVSV